MTTATAGNVASGSEKEKEKPGMRRALGRGLASLLPGPRVVPPPQTPVSPTAPATPPTSASSATVPAPEVRADLDSRPGAAAPHTPLPHDVEPYVGWPELQGRPATHPEGYQPPYDSSADGGPITLQAAAETRIPGNLVVNLAITDVDKNPFQTRYVEDDDALEELANSIKANGVVQPILVRPSDDKEGRYTLILGERRLHASKKAGKTHIPSLVRKVSAQQAAEMTIVEN